MGDVTIFENCSLSYSLFPLEAARGCKFSNLTFYAGSQDKSNLEATATMESEQLFLPFSFSSHPQKILELVPRGPSQKPEYHGHPGPKNHPGIKLGHPLPPDSALLCHIQYNVLGGQSDLFYQ